MDTLHERLAELADEAPTGGAPPAELWARGKRAHRRRAAAVAATVLVVGAVGTGIGVRLAEGDDRDDGSDLAPAGTVDITLPIEYPVGEELQGLGDTPGPLAAVWVVPRAGGAADVVGLVAESGMFGTLPIEVEVWSDPDPRTPQTTYAEVALSSDGRRIAYEPPTGELVVRDLESGEAYSSSAFEFGIRHYKWVDATHLLGRVAEGSDADGWLWEPGTTPELVNFYLVPYGGTDLALPMQGSDPRECDSRAWGPTLQNLQIREQNPGDDWAGAFEVPMLCDLLGVTGSGILLGHWNSDRLPGNWDEPNDGNRTVVALDIHGAEMDCRQRCKLSFEDPALPRVVATAEAPLRVAFAADLIGEALDAEGGAS